MASLFRPTPEERRLTASLANLRQAQLTKDLSSWACADQEELELDFEEETDAHDG